MKKTKKSKAFCNLLPTFLKIYLVETASERSASSVMVSSWFI